MKLILNIIFLSGLVQITLAQSLESKIDKLVEESFINVPSGLSIIVTEKGQSIYHKAFGKADIELDVKMHKENIYRIGSITKQFTSTAILKLAEEGKLNVEDKLSKYLPDFNTCGHEVTIEHLLTHTSGIPSYTNSTKWTPEVRRKDFEPMALIEEFAADSMEFEPGSKMHYNNTGYFILGYIIEKVSGMSYAAYIQKNIFDVVGMESSYYGDPFKIIKNRASGYDPIGNEVQNSSFLSMTQPYAAGSLLSNVADLAKWNKAIFDYTIITKESLVKAHTAYTLSDQSSTGYGYGWGIGERYGESTISHGGGINGYLSMGIYFPKSEVYVAILSNCTCFSPDDLATKIGATVIGLDIEKKEIELSTEQLNKFIGKYELNQQFGINVTLKDDQLYGQATGQQAFPIFPSSKTRFFLKVVEAEVEFYSTDGVVDSLTLFQGGQELKMKKVE